MTSGALLNSTIGDYRLVSFLGAGGMGEVYRAVHVKLNRAVAIKLLSRDSEDAGFLQRFWNEARVHASLHHPNIAELYDLLEYEGRPCIVMEYVDGQTLSDRLRAGALAPVEAMPIFRAIAGAMAYVHEQGIVHRDLKSANVRISSRGVVKLLDFGIAKGGSTPSLTKTGAIIGTLLYMAPEQLRGEPATPRSDVWSLGVMLYEMVVGRPPFRADAVGELIDLLASGAYDKPSAACSRAPGAPTLLPAVDRIVGRCLRRSPADRYPSAGELAQDLDLAWGGERVPRGPERSVSASSGAPTAAMEAGLDWLRRRRMPALGVAAAVIVVLLAFALWPPAPGTTPAAPGPAPTSPVSAAPSPRPATPAAGKTIHRIDVAEGRAGVYVNGTFVGTTPFDYEARKDESISLELRQDGFVPMTETFVVTERRVWTFAMRKVQGRLP